MELDPLNLSIQANLGHTYYLARRFDEAVKQLHKTIDMEPGFAMAHGLLGKVYEHLGNYQQAIAERAQFEILMGANPDKIAARRATLEKALATSGSTGYWRKVLESPERSDVPPARARAYAYLGEQQKALEELEKLYQERVVFIPAPWIRGEPAFDILHSNPRFAELMRRMHLPPP